MRPSARWRRDPYSNAITARRVAGKIYDDLQYIAEQHPGASVYAPTFTLPGRWSSIRRAPLGEQYDWLNSRVQMKGKPGMHSMRGLNTVLKDFGACGGWWFYETKYNQEELWWNMHLHGLFVATDWGSNSAGDALPVSESIVTAPDESMDIDTWEDKLVPGHSPLLHGMGLGPRYTLDHVDDVDEAISYCAALSYCSKQQLEGPETELVQFLRSRKPNLHRSWGDAMISADDRMSELIETDKHEMVDMYQARKDWKHAREHDPCAKWWDGLLNTPNDSWQD